MEIFPFCVISLGVNIESKDMDTLCPIPETAMWLTRGLFHFSRLHISIREGCMAAFSACLSSLVPPSILLSSEGCWSPEQAEVMVEVAPREAPVEGVMGSVLWSWEIWCVHEPVSSGLPQPCSCYCP